MSKPTARDVMTTDVLTVQDDATVGELASFLLDQDISGAPVADSRGDLVGVVSLTDLARCASEDSGSLRQDKSPDYFVRGWEDKLEPSELTSFYVENKECSVSDIMTRSLFSVTPDTPATEIAAIMARSHIHRVLVTEGKKAVGIVTSLDLLRLIADEALCDDG